MKKLTLFSLIAILALATDQMIGQYVIPASGVALKTASHNVIAEDNGKLIVMNCATACTLTLPGTPRTPKWAIWVASIGSRTVTVARNGLTIDGASSDVALARFQSIYIGTDGSSYFTSRGIGANPVGNNGDVQYENGTALAARGNISHAPAYAQYVTSAGNDSNDGLSWNTAKGTIYAAITSLPYGGSGFAGVGTVYVGSGASVGGPIKNQGIWLIGSNDPNYRSPPEGWLKWRSGFSPPQALKIVGYAPMIGAANSRDTTATMTCANPCVWLSAVSGGFSMENIAFPNYLGGSYIKVGITSTGDRTGRGGTSGVAFRNITANPGGGSVLGSGPCIDVGSNGFWIDFDKIVCSGNGAEIYTIVATTGLSRSSGVVSARTTQTNDMFVGQSITVWNATDSTFNGSYTVTGVSGAPQTTVTWNQAGPNATSGGGYMWNDRAFAIAINPGSGTGSGSILIKDLQTSYGGVRMNCGTSGGTIQGNYLYEDAPFGPAPPTVEYVGSPGNGHCGGSFTHVEQADISISVPAIMNWAGTFVSADYVSGAGINVYGPVIVGAQDRFTSYNTKTSPIANGQVGTYNGVLVGAEDASRRNFPASSVRFPNLAYTNPYQWSTNGTSGYVSGGTLATGVLAPDGTNGAATWTSSNGFIGFWFQSSVIPTPNDWYVGGVWARSTTGNGFSSGEATKFEIGALASPSSGDYCYGGNTVVYSNAYMVGDGQWFWMTFACKIWSGATSTTLAFWGGGNDSTHTVQFYAPILVRIPAGTLSDNEVWEFVRNLSTYDNGCAAGSVCNIGGQVPRNVTGYEDVKAISPPTNPATGYQRWFANSATGQFNCITSSGADCALTKLAVYNTASAASNTNISAMNMVASASAQHDYLFAWTISLTAVGNGCTGNTTVVLNEIHTDPNGGGAVTVPLQTITLANSGNGTVGFIASGAGNILAATGTAVQYSTSSYTAGSGCTTNPSYKVQPTLVQLW